MPTFDLRDAMLEGGAIVKEVFRSVIIDFTTPMMEEELAKQWAMLPPDLKDKMAREKPEEYANLISLIGGK